MTFGGRLLLLYRLVYNVGWSPDANSGRMGAEKICTRSIGILCNCGSVGGLIIDRDRVAEKRRFTRCGPLKPDPRLIGSDLVHVTRHGLPVRTPYRGTWPAKYLVS